MTSPAFRRFLWGGLIVAAFLAGYLQIFTLFMLYDDEGYVLTSLNQFARHGGLYDQVYSQYGPLFYLIFGGVARLGQFAWTHDIGRFVTLVHWVGAAGAGGWICWQLTRSHLASAVAFAATFVHLWQMAAEPMHPGGALALWIALGAGFTLKFLLADRPRRFALTVGLTAASCALVKINVGLFVAAAGFMWMWLNRSPRGGRAGGWDAALVAVAASGPAVLMWRSWQEPWAAIFAGVGGVAIASVGGWATQQTRPEFDLGSARTALGTVAGVVGLTTGAIWICGTSPAQLIQGSLVGPLSHANIYHFPFNWRSGTVVGTVLSAIWCGYLLRTRSLPLWSRQFLGGLRIVILVAVVLAGFHLPPRSLGLVMTTFGITLWWMVAACPGEKNASARGRAWLGLLVAWQFLHAYPVAGSQIGWGTFLWVPLAVTAVHESLRYGGQTRSVAWTWQPRGAACAVGAGVGAIMIGQLHAGFTYYALTAPLNLPGARHLRVFPALGSAIRIMNLNAKLDNTSLFSLPGAFSFNLWTGLEPPTGSNVTHWFSLLDERRQREIEHELDRRATPLIVQPKMVNTHLHSFIDQTSPLFEYVMERYESRIEVDDLALWRHKNDPRPVINIAELFTPAASPAAPAVTRIVSVKLAIPPGHQITGVELAVFGPDDTVSNFVALWHTGNTQVEAHPLEPDGKPVPDAGFRACPWPIAAAGLQQFQFYPSEPLPEVPLSRIWLRCRDLDGNVIAEARFANSP